MKKERNFMSLEKTCWKFDGIDQLIVKRHGSIFYADVWERLTTYRVVRAMRLLKYKLVNKTLKKSFERVFRLSDKCYFSIECKKKSSNVVLSFTSSVGINMYIVLSKAEAICLFDRLTSKKGGWLKSYEPTSFDEDLEYLIKDEDGEEEDLSSPEEKKLFAIEVCKTVE